MTRQPELQRIQADLEGAQAEIDTASKVDGSLGDSLSFGFTSLLAAVRHLFAGMNDHSGRIATLISARPSRTKCLSTDEVFAPSDSYR